MPIFEKTYDDGSVVESMLDPDRLDSLYDRIRDIHKKEFPDWSISQLFKELFTRHRDFLHDWVSKPDELLIDTLRQDASELNAALGIDTKQEDNTCTENH